MSDLPVREIVLYKHGVGFFVREGTVEGEDLALTFRADEINDILKSLTVIDRGGGKVLGIHYQTPMDKAARLASSSIKLSTQASVRDMLRDLRGREVYLELETMPGEKEEIQARIIGIDDPHLGDNNNSTYTPDEVLLSVLVGDNMVSVYPLHSLRSVLIQDNQSQHDLRYFLDTSMREDIRRTVNVRLSRGKHQVAVTYVAPSPTWRVSYRIVAQSEKNVETGKALLQGWGLFDNRLEEDLENVKVTLVAGQPISFIYDLYASRIPERPRVQDEARVAPAPMQYEAARPMAAAPAAHSYKMSTGGAAADTEDGAPLAQARGGSLLRRIDRHEFAESLPPAAEGKEAGEFFQYNVTAPVSVKRGESALVPIIGKEVGYGRELLYNRAKLAGHPVAALRFQNTTGLTLERGPVTVVEDGDYKGEAIIPFTKEDNEVYVPYAVELGIKIVEHVEQETRVVSLSIKDAYAIFEQYRIQRVTYKLENTSNKPQVVTLETSINPPYELFETPNPDAETLTERRWKVSIPARSRTEFVHQERQRSQHQESVRDWNYQKLTQFFRNQWLDQSTFDQLTMMLSKLTLIAKLQAEGRELDNERQTRFQEQEQVRENLKTLNAEGEEATLRKRMLDKLSATQDRLEAIEARQAQLKTQIAATEAEVEGIIKGLG